VISYNYSSSFSLSDPHTSSLKLWASSSDQITSNNGYTPISTKPSILFRIATQ